MIPSPLVTFQVFEELSINFIDSLPKNDVRNLFICDYVRATHYCELVGVEAATAIIAAPVECGGTLRLFPFSALRPWNALR